MMSHECPLTSRRTFFRVPSSGALDPVEVGRFIAERFSMDHDSVMSALRPIMFVSVAELLAGSAVSCRSSLARSSSEALAPFSQAL